VSRPRLYLVRHGETEWNATGRMLTRTDAPLNAVGEAQAAELATALKSIRWDRAISSPLMRARRTADLLLAARPDAPALETDDRLRERDAGPFEGWTDEQMLADPVAVHLRTDRADIPGVETDAEAAERVRSFLDSLGEVVGTTLVVGHGGTLRVLLALAMRLPPSFATSLRMRNCRPAIIEPGRRPLLLAFNAGNPTYEALATRDWS
jgi:broad specificity phosphatase PhoE